MKDNKKIIKSNKGITLVALIITIIVLLILAIVTIVVITNQGIITHAQNAASDYNKAQELEKVTLAVEDAKIANNGGIITRENLVSALNKQFGENNYEISEGETAPYTLTIANGTGTKYTIDENGNVTTKEIVNGVAIPTNFHYVTGSTKEEGIVVADENGNEYVWVPVTKNEDGTPTEPYKETNGKMTTTKGEVEIQLGRYEFDSSGKPKSLSGNTYTEDTAENHNSNYENAIAKDIEKFKESVSKNGGYFIGRYEAGIENGTLNLLGFHSGSNIAPNTNWTGWTGGTLVVKQGKQVWNYITQNKSSELCRNMDSNYTGITSDLLNSYAWDTAIVFIQNCAGDMDYANKTRLQKSIAKTGEATDGRKNDVRCNIYDMAGNCFEWTTETNIDLDKNCVRRGATYWADTSYTSYRLSYKSNLASSTSSFRPILYWQI